MFFAGKGIELEIPIKQNKPDLPSQVLHVFSYFWNLGVKKRK
jgi:hypothetical protein